MESPIILSITDGFVDGGLQSDVVETFDFYVAPAVTEILFAISSSLG
jgi:hypothetical protein